MASLSFAGTAALLFAMTDVDDLIVLVSFFADPRFRAGEIVAGQMAGMAAIFGASVAASLVSVFVPPAAVGLLGVVPILIGLRGLLDLRLEHPAACIDGPTVPTRVVRFGRIATVAVVTIANGGDNIATYAPVLATRSTGDAAVFGFVVLVMTAVWCVLGRLALHHPAVLPAVTRIGRRALPFLLIALGASILYRAGTLHRLGLG